MGRRRRASALAGWVGPKELPAQQTPAAKLGSGLWVSRSIRARAQRRRSGPAPAGSTAFPSWRAPTRAVARARCPATSWARPRAGSTGATAGWTGATAEQPAPPVHRTSAARASAASRATARASTRRTSTRRAGCTRRIARKRFLARFSPCPADKLHVRHARAWSRPVSGCVKRSVGLPESTLSGSPRTDVCRRRSHLCPRA